MKTRLALLGLLVALLLPLPARSQDEPKPPADLLAHVKVGQRWTFSLPAAGPLTIERKVTAVLPAEGRVVYTETSIAGERRQEDVDQEWLWTTSPPYPANALIQGYSTGRETLEVGALKLECAFMRIEADGDVTQHWTAVKGDLETFPGLVRQRSGGQVLYELLRVEGP
jgi:hypothetical protein